MASTPPPPSALRMPPTPRHGAGYDQYEPYTTRHSTRLAGQRASRDTTPPPSFPSSHLRTSPRKAKKQDSEHATLSPPGSGHASPRKKSDRSGRLAAAYSLDGPASGPDDSDPFVTAEPSAKNRGLQSHRPNLTAGMLPTPAKTPRKKAVGDIGSAARTLFPPPSGSGRKKKKYTGFSLDSFEEDAPGGSAIQIYTDSRDRIPELDKREGNLFYKKKPEASSTSARTSKRKEADLKRDKEVDDVLKREDGMVYVFRGKKMFRKFTDPVESEAEDDDDDLGLLAARPDLLDSTMLPNSRPLTRSAIKPRVLFPGANGPAPAELEVSDPDEEAATDIEDHMLDDAEESDDRVADLELQQRPVTPTQDSAIETPASPGATIRSLRPRTKRDAPEHSRTPTASEAKRKRISPFAGWLRKKEGPAVAGTRTKKRDAEVDGSPGGPATKRTRGSRSAVSS